MFGAARIGRVKLTRAEVGAQTAVLNDRTECPGTGWVLGIFLATLVVYWAAVPRVLRFTEPPTGDQPHYLQTTISLVDDRDFDEFNNYNESASYQQFTPPVPYPPGFAGIRVDPVLDAADHVFARPTQAGEAWYSSHGLGMPILILPGWIVGKAASPLLAGLTANGGGGWPGTVFEMALLGSVLGVQVFLLAWEMTRQRSIAVAVWAALSFSNPQMTYSLLIFPEMPAALLTIYAFRRLALTWASHTVRQAALVGVCIGYLPWLHPRLIPVAAGLLLLAVYRVKYARSLGAPAAGLSHWRLGISSPARPVALFGPVVLLGLLLVAYDLRVHGSPLPLSEHRAGFFVPTVDQHGVPGLSEWPALLLAFAGLLLDQQFGLLVYAPVFVLAIVGCVALWQARPGRRLLLWLAVVVLPYVLIVGDYREWWGGWCPPARYLASITPLLAAALAQSLLGLRNSRLYRLVFATLASWGVLAMLGFMVGMGDPAVGQTFFRLPAERAPLTSWLEAQVHLDLSPVLPPLVAWFADPQGDVPWPQIGLWLLVLGALTVACLDRLAATSVHVGAGAPNGSTTTRRNHIEFSSGSSEVTTPSARTFLSARLLRMGLGQRLISSLLLGSVAASVLLVWVLSSSGFITLPTPALPSILRPAATQRSASVREVQLVEPAPNSDVYRLEATISAGAASGPANVIFRLRDRSTGDVVQASTRVELTRSVALRVVAELEASRADYEPQVEVQFPAR